MSILNGVSSQVNTPVSETPPMLNSAEDGKGQEKLTLQSFENNKNLDDSVADSAPTTVTRARERKATRAGSAHVSRNSLQEDREDGDLSVEDEDEIYIKDAFLVFRSLCKLSQKVLTYDQQQDLRSQNMRSKLLSCISFITSSTTIPSSSLHRFHLSKEGPAMIQLLSCKLQNHICV